MKATFGISTRRANEPPKQLDNLIDRWVYNQIRTHRGILAMTLYRKARHPETEIVESLYRLICLGLILPVNKRWYVR